ncbi:MAG TPA: redoxin family protein [Longimicrobiales bacterium]|nr:redoxin family protein [Longimicrobiales bacterium]
MNWSRAIVGGAIAGSIIALLGFGMTQDPGEIPSPLPGKAAPAFSLQIVDQPTKVDLASLRGQVVVLNFWASWCLNCRTEHNALSTVARRYEGKGVHFYGVIYNDTPENAQRWIQMMGGQSYPALIDANARTAINYGLYGVPETFFISRDGRVAHKQIGPSSEAVLIEWIEKLLEEEV